mmetsp:Transcript_7438/g.12815  ORF Transcript_7438/g.12815 Transcript_7438/m.12815 type:complete len:202 (-) Transcript_7438:458-1063(-)
MFMYWLISTPPGKGIIFIPIKTLLSTPSYMAGCMKPCMGKPPGAIIGMGTPQPVAIACNHCICIWGNAATIGCGTTSDPFGCLFLLVVLLFAAPCKVLALAFFLPATRAPSKRSDRPGTCEPGRRAPGAKICFLLLRPFCAACLPGKSSKRNGSCCPCSSSSTGSQSGCPASCCINSGPLRMRLTFSSRPCHLALVTWQTL